MKEGNCLAISSPLDWFNIDVFLLSRDIVWSHDAGLQTGCYNAGEHPTKGIEPTLVRCGDHFGDIHTQGCL